MPGQMQKSDGAPGYMKSAADEWGANRARVLRATIGNDLTNEEFSLFVEVCRAKKLDPFSRQIYAVKRFDSMVGEKRMTIQTGIDGFRTLAQRTGQYKGQRGPFWCGPDGVWREVWLEDGPPAAAKVEVLRADFDEPLVGVALYREYVQTKKNGDVTHMWNKFETVMLAKCAESITLRRAFPEELSGLYTTEEMDQTDPQQAEMARVQQNIESAQQAINSTQPVGEIAGDVVDADYEEPKPEQKVDRGGANATGAAATKTLLKFVSAMDTCENEDEVKSTREAWEEKARAFPKAEPYFEAYANYRAACFRMKSHDDEPDIAPEEMALVEAIESMREAYEARVKHPAEDNEEESDGSMS